MSATLNLQYISCGGRELVDHLPALARLRMDVFREFPYLYEGDLDYELRYLDRYVRSDSAYAGLIFDQQSLVGATTAIALEDEDESFRGPLVARGYLPEQVVYFGESLLRPAYRGMGLGKRFMEERLGFARRMPLRRWAAFCAVIRPATHPQRPANYQPLNSFWEQSGFTPLEGAVAEYKWQEIGRDKETNQRLQYWLRPV